MSQPKLLKVFVTRHGKVVHEVATEYKQTPKMLTKIVFLCERYGDQYDNKNIRLDELMKLHPGFRSIPVSGCVYCFEDDLEAAEKILVEAINERVRKMLKGFIYSIDEHNKSVEGVPGALKISHDLTTWC